MRKKAIVLLLTLLMLMSTCTVFADPNDPVLMMQSITVTTEEK